MYIVKEEEEKKGGYLLGSTSSKRQRFYIELKHGETAIVSWKKLLRDATEIDQYPPVMTLDDQSTVGQRDNSFPRDKKPGHRPRIKSSDNKQRMIPKIEFPIADAEKNDGLIRELEDCERAHRLALENTNSMLQRYLSRFDTSMLVRNSQLEGLHDVPVTYSKNRSTHSQDTSLLLWKTKHDMLRNTQMVSSEMGRIHTKTGNDSSDVTGQTYARRSAPWQTYQRSRTSVDGRKNKVESTVQNDDVIGLTMKTNVSNHPSTTACIKRKVTDAVDRHILNPSPFQEAAHNNPAQNNPSLLPKSSHYDLLKRTKMETWGKTNMKIRFRLRSEDETRKSKEQASHLKSS